MQNTIFLDKPRHTIDRFKGYALVVPRKDARGGNHQKHYDAKGQTDNHMLFTNRKTAKTDNRQKHEHR